MLNDFNFAYNNVQFRAVVAAIALRLKMPYSR